MIKKKYMNKNILITFALLTINIGSIQAEVKLPNIISDHMVIQQNTSVNIWGWADAGELVKVKGSWQDEIVSTTANEQGKWLVNIDSPNAGGGYEIEIEGENKIVIKDVLAGEVWLASGQSNMAFALKHAENSENDIAKSANPGIRLFHIERKFAETPQENCIGKWVKCNPESVKDFSAVAYYFGRDIYEKIKVPVGLISSSKGGSPVEAWIDAETLEANKNIHSVFELWNEKEAAYPGVKKQYILELNKWEKEQAKDSLQKIISKPKLPSLVDEIERTHHRRPGYLYNAMIAPIVNFTIKGVMWYQGANNVNRWDGLKSEICRVNEYQGLFQLLINDWRNIWDTGSFPFYFVQLAQSSRGSDGANASLLREAQLFSMKIPNTGMVVTADIGDLNDSHPKNKLDVGKRLAMWALAKTYGFDDIVCSGPLYKSMIIEGNKIRLFFDYTGTGLTVKGNELLNFEIAGRDKVFRDATAVIEGPTVVVYSEHVREPEAARHSWDVESDVYLYNKEGLPASPFRTDDWEIEVLE